MRPEFYELMAQWFSNNKIAVSSIAYNDRCVFTPVNLENYMSSTRITVMSNNKVFMHFDDKTPYCHTGVLDPRMPEFFDQLFKFMQDAKNSDAL
jgi:hypothetical protein